MIEFVGPVDLTRLRRELKQRGMDEDSYCLYGGHPSERYVLDHHGAEWVVCYSERGLESGLRSFPTEDLACGHLADLLVADGTTRLQS